MSISGMGFTGSDIGGFAEQPSGDLYARWIQWVFFIRSVGHTLQGIMEIRSHGHLMKTLLILLENLLTYGISCYHIYIPCFGNILKKEFYA
jgi:hypothetical protein